MANKDRNGQPRDLDRAWESETDTWLLRYGLKAVGYLLQDVEDYKLADDLLDAMVVRSATASDMALCMHVHVKSSSPVTVHVLRSGTT